VAALLTASPKASGSRPSDQVQAVSVTVGQALEIATNELRMYCGARLKPTPHHPVLFLCFVARSFGGKSGYVHFTPPIVFRFKGQDIKLPGKGNRCPLCSAIYLLMDRAVETKPLRLKSSTPTRDAIPTDVRTPLKESGVRRDDRTVNTNTNVEQCGRHA